MAATEPIPSLAELLDAFHAETTLRRALRQLPPPDTHEGSLYDHMAGLGALVLSRVAERDRHEFRSVYFATAEGDRLDTIVTQRFGRARALDTRGTGTAKIRRPTAAAGAGTIWEGTRIFVSVGRGDAARYLRVSADTAIGASQTELLTLPVEAELPGPDGAIEGTIDEFAALRFDDPLWDNSWEVREVACGAGTLRERDPDYRAAARQERKDRRPGMPRFIESKCKAAGASLVVAFAGNYLGDASDHGLNRVFVGDASGETPAPLLEACRLAMPGAAMAGTSVQVLPMTTANLSLAVAIKLRDEPDNLGIAATRDEADAAVLEYFRQSEHPFVWSYSGIRGAILRAVRNLYDLTLTASLAEPVLASMFDSGTLLRYRVDPWSIATKVTGPNG
jgi:hypothetical protein